MTGTLTLTVQLDNTNQLIVTPALTVRGATWTKPNGNFGFERMDATVNVGTNTAVTEEGQVGAFTVVNISVGQHIDAFGMACVYFCWHGNEHGR